MSRKQYLKEYGQQRYQDPKYREQLKESNKRNREKTRDWLKSYKKTLSCANCQESHPACLDFHHLDPLTKDRAVKDRRNWGIARIQKEISKCIVLCANCHRKQHYKE